MTRRGSVAPVLGAASLALGAVGFVFGDRWSAKVSALAAGVAGATAAALTRFADAVQSTTPDVTAPTEPEAEKIPAGVAAATPSTPGTGPATGATAPAPADANGPGGSARTSDDPGPHDFDVFPLDDLVSAGLVDAVTGLFSSKYFQVAVVTRVTAARRHLRPVAVVLADIEPGPGWPDGSPAPTEAIADAIRLTLREADTACRLDDGRFAFVLEDTNPEGAQLTVVRLVKALDRDTPGLVRRVGIACYPAHAFSPGEALAKAEAALAEARNGTSGPAGGGGGDVGNGDAGGEETISLDRVVLASPD